jgi:hypothetical protein
MPRYRFPPDNVSSWYRVPVNKYESDLPLVETWLINNTEGDFYPKWLTVWRTSVSQSGKNLYEVYFESQDDAVLFALTWGHDH